MSSLFKGKTETQESSMDPWAVLPDSVKQDLIDKSGMSADMMQASMIEQVKLGKNPREILEMNGMEGDAADQVIAGIDEQEALGDKATGGLEVGQDAYESGYTEDVVDTTLAGMDRNAAREQLARDSKNAAIGGTSNSRSAVADAVAGGEQSRARAEMEAGLRDEGHRFAVDSDFTARDMTDRFATSGMARDLSGADWLKGYGGEQRGLEQQQLDENRNAESDSLSWLSGIMGQGPNTALGGGVGTEEVEKPSTFSQLVGGATAIGGMVGMMSDEESKRDIEDAPSGLEALKDARVSTYRYKEDAPIQSEAKENRTTGLIAQDLSHIEGAVTRRPDGYLQVEPYAVLATVVKAVQELDQRTTPQAGL